VIRPRVPKAARTERRSLDAEVRARRDLKNKAIAGWKQGRTRTRGARIIACEQSTTDQNISFGCIE
jgi:hypothetical protein